MSTISIQPKVFAAVMTKVQQTTQRDCMMSLNRAFGIDHQPNNYYWLEKVNKIVAGWIYRLYQYNNITATLNHTHGTFEEVCEALLQNDMAMAAEAEAIANIEPQSITLEQCYMFLRCIDYNTDLEGWDGQKYYAQEWMEQYHKDKAILTDIINRMANHIAMETARESGAKWCDL